MKVTALLLTVSAMLAVTATTWTLTAASAASTISARMTSSVPVGSPGLSSVSVQNAPRFATGPSNPYVKPTPPYAKWGKLAVTETKKRFPKASVVDYLHVGRQVVSSTTSAEVFKLWMKEGRREFGVIVRIVFDTNTEKVQDIGFQTTTR